MAVEAVEVEVGFDRRGGSEFAQGTHVVAREYQVGFFFLFFFFPCVQRYWPGADELSIWDFSMDALPEFSFRRVLIKGQFTGPPILLGPQTYEGFPGYHLILPFLRPGDGGGSSGGGGSTILVNRGFITTTRANAIRAGSQVPPGLTRDKAGKLVGNGEEVVVEGLLPKTGERTVWMHENKPETNEWFWKDVEKMAEVCGGEEKGVQPVLVDALAGVFSVVILGKETGN